MDYSPPSSEDQNAIIAGLLALLRLLADGFANAYGAPGELVRAAPIYGELRDKALRWLHDMACVARRLILLRAMQMEKPPSVDDAPSLDDPCARDGRPREIVGFGPQNDPSLWRVRFSAGAPYDAAWLKSGVQQKTGRTRDSKMEIYFADDPRPLAEKFEAVLRVLNDVDLHAAQLAARMHRWKGRAYRLEKFVTAMAGVALICNAAGLVHADWDAFAAARDAAKNMLPLYLRVESG